MWNNEYLYKTNPQPIIGIRFKELYPTYDRYIELNGDPLIYTEDLYNLLLGVAGNIYFNRITMDTILPYYWYIYSVAFKKYELALEWNTLDLNALISDTLDNSNLIHNVGDRLTPTTVEEFKKYLAGAVFNKGISKTNILKRVAEIENNFKTADQIFLSEMEKVFIISMDHSITGGN